MLSATRDGLHHLPLLLALTVATTLAFTSSSARATADAPAAEAKGDDRLTGRWVGQHEDEAIALSCLPDGRYFFTFGTAAAPKREAGRCRIDGDRIKFTTNQGKS